jgi:nucleoside-diphosphate-sugar epimerase
MLKSVLVTGALGQIGAELVTALRERLGSDRVVASDIRMPAQPAEPDGPFVYADVTVRRMVDEAVRKHDVGDVNMGGLYRVLEVARENRCAVFFPSSIGAFGPTTPKDQTPQDTLQRPTTMYGVTKVAGELLCDYYYKRFGVDTRGLRYPGLISHVAPPGGGTTDYAVEIFYEAIRNKRYTCFLAPDACLDMMYMPDAIKAAIDLMDADPGRLQHRNAFNVTSFHFTPETLAAEIRKHIPEFTIEYEVDPVRQSIAESWPNAIDDRAARAEWDWEPEYDLEAMTRDMLENLRKKLKGVG